MSKARSSLAALAVALAASLALAGASGAQQAPQTQHADPDWPCVQRKVPSLTPAAIWTGPALDGAGNWRDDPDVAPLVRRLAQRRMPIEEATAEVEAFGKDLGPRSGADKLTLLFAGLFETMNAERGDIMKGIERYARRQKALAEEIRREAARIDEAGEAAVSEDDREKLRWDQRVFEERRASLSYICDAPRMVEQRLFALGRAVGKTMPD